MAASRNQPMTSRDLAEEAHLIDQGRGRRYCPVHPHQQKIPLLPGMDACPACTPADRNQAGGPHLRGDDTHVSDSKKTVDAAKGRRDRDSTEAGATTREQRQEMVSQRQHRKAVREDRV